MNRLPVLLAALALGLGACNSGNPEAAEATTATTAAPGSTTSTASISSTTLTTTTVTTTTTVVSTTTTTRPPEPGVIAYNRDGQLWLINADGTDPRQLLADMVVEGAPSWSPDGRWLAFSGFEPGPQIVTPDIWIVTADGRSLTNLTHSPGPSMLSPSWSPDGSRIAFASTDRNLWIVKTDGSGLEQLTSDTAHQSAPAWAPDGSLIAYCSLPVTGGLLGADDIWVMTPDGGNPRQLTTDGDSCLPAWSPDSSQIAFTVWVFPQDASSDYSDIWVMSRDGTGLRNLTSDTTRFDRSPTWSPDGATIAIDSAGPLSFRQDPDVGLVIEHDPPADLYLLDPVDGETSQLTAGNEAEGAPAWRPSS